MTFGLETSRLTGPPEFFAAETFGTVETQIPTGGNVSVIGCFRKTCPTVGFQAERCHI